MPTNKTPFTFHMDDKYLQKIKIIAREETRSLSNMLEHLCRQHIARYEREHGEIKFSDDE